MEGGCEAGHKHQSHSEPHQCSLPPPLCPGSYLPGPPEQCLAIPWGQSMMYGPSLPDLHGTQRPSFITSAEEQSLSVAVQGLSSGLRAFATAAVTIWPHLPPEE